MKCILKVFLYFVKASASTFNNVEVVQQFDSENIDLNMVNCKENNFNVIRNIKIKVCPSTDLVAV